MTAREEPYKVLIPYREPTYELRRAGGPRRKPFLSGFRVLATSEQAAIEKAVRQFKDRARSSSVNWVREIDHAGIQVERI